jgi:hypothetical protein
VQPAEIDVPCGIHRADTDATQHDYYCTACGNSPWLQSDLCNKGGPAGVVAARATKLLCSGDQLQVTCIDALSNTCTGICMNVHRDAISGTAACHA